jgi:hypothetical protein
MGTIYDTIVFGMTVYKGLQARRTDSHRELLTSLLAIQGFIYYW